MSSYDTWHNLLSGISQGSFDKIYVKDSSGPMTDILTLLAGAGGTVPSATPPLTINSGDLSLDLSGFCTSASTPLSLTGGRSESRANQWSVFQAALFGRSPPNISGTRMQKTIKT